MKFLSRMRSGLRNLTNKKGQGATEYILLLVVIVGLVMMFGPKIKTAMEKKVGSLEEDLGKVHNNQ
jgi:hypothetical protein